MTNKKITKAIILFIGSAVLCTAVVLIFVFVHGNPADNLGLGIFSAVIAFSVLPAYAVAIEKYKEADFHSAFMLGYVFGFGLEILPLVFAPFFAVWYYVDLFIHLRD